MQRSSLGAYGLVGVGLSALLIGIILVVRMLRPEPAGINELTRSRGPFNAPVQIIEYSDFQCPSCRVAQDSIRLLLSRYPTQIRLVFQHFPLQGHRWSALAHQSAECAAKQNKFWVYHDRLYLDQPLWAVFPQTPLERFLEYAKDAGLDLDRFSRCLSDGSVTQKIHGEELAGVGLGVRSTPSFFVNGNLAVGGKALQDEVEKILGKK